MGHKCLVHNDKLIFLCVIRSFKIISFTDYILHLIEFVTVLLSLWTLSPQTGTNGHKNACLPFQMILSFSGYTQGHPHHQEIHSPEVNILLSYLDCSMKNFKRSKNAQ